MSQLQEYIEAACGYDSNGLPAALTQFTFGTMPFAMAETEQIADVMTVSKAFQTDALVDIQIVDSICMVSFDFSMDTQTLVEFYEELDFYKQQTAHVSNIVMGYNRELQVALETEDENAVADISTKLRLMSLPFMLPTIIPTQYGGTVNIGFDADPKFVFFSSNALNQMPTKVIMIFDANQLFAEDELAVYNMDEEEEIRMMQEEMFYMDEARKAEEAAFQQEYGLYSQDYYSDDDNQSDGRLRGVRFK